MKTIEEKAKCYDEAIERAKKWYNKEEPDSYTCIVESIFPELKESEDEMIRKALIKYYSFDKDGGSHDLDNITPKQIIAWLEKQGEPVDINPTEFDTRLQALIGKFDSLPKEELIGILSFWMNVVQNDGTYKSDEKQGEQKPADKVEPKFKVEKGKWYVCNTSRYTDFIVGKVYYCPKNGMLKPNENEIARYIASDCFRLWTIQDAKAGDVFVDEDTNVIGIFEGIEGMCWHSKLYYSCYTKELYGIECGGFHLKEFAKPATKEQRDLLFQKMKEAGYEWDANKLELRKVDSCVPWSDEQTRRNLIGFIKQLGATEIPSSEYNRYVDFLEKLGEQKLVEWSDDDKRIIDGLIFICDKAQDNIPKLTAGFTHIETLKNWLKSFKDRVQPQPKQEWNKEDEDILNTIINHFEIDLECTENDDIIRWLKSLKPQNKWKPSDEQMKTLKEACDEHWEPDGLDPLYTLYEQLKKLTEE